MFEQLLLQASLVSPLIADLLGSSFGETQRKLGIICIGRKSRALRTKLINSIGFVNSEGNSGTAVMHWVFASKFDGNLKSKSETKTQN